MNNYKEKCRVDKDQELINEMIYQYWFTNNRWDGWKKVIKSYTQKNPNLINAIEKEYLFSPYVKDEEKKDLLGYRYCLLIFDYDFTTSCSEEKHEEIMNQYMVIRDRRNKINRILQ